MIFIVILLYTLIGKTHNEHKYTMPHTINYMIVICTVHNNNTIAYQCQDTGNFQNKLIIDNRCWTIIIHVIVNVQLAIWIIHRIISTKGIFSTTSNRINYKIQIIL